MNGTHDFYEAVIGLEVHVELKTATKAFCACSTEFGAVPNTNVCPTCLGMPGTLPVFNEKVLSLAVRAGLALHAEIADLIWFDRKNYFYPDLPKGYQITQYDRPLCRGGEVRIRTSTGERSVSLERIHMEEDAAKLLHKGDETLIDFNRAGVPLIEIVSKAEMHTPEEAMAYLDSLRRTLSYIGVSDCKMNEGSLRVDVNVSVRKKGEPAYGTKTEIKNINSVHSCGKAIEYETERQISLLEQGEKVEAETRRFNEDAGKTELMRKKETHVDYRYFTEPDIPPIVVTRVYCDAVRKQMPNLPEEDEEILRTQYGVKAEDTELIAESPEMTMYFRSCADRTEHRAVCASLFVSSVLPMIAQDGCKIEPACLAEISDMFAKGQIVSGVAKKLVAMSAEEGLSPQTIAARENFVKVTDGAWIENWAKEAMTSNPNAVADYRKGKTVAIKQLIGTVMRTSRGRADPVVTEQILIQLLEK